MASTRSVLLLQLLVWLLLGISFADRVIKKPVSVPVCPPTHQRAFARGAKCCAYLDHGTKLVAPWSSDICPSGDVVACPAGSGCEDNPPSCYDAFELEGVHKVGRIFSTHLGPRTLSQLTSAARTTKGGTIDQMIATRTRTSYRSTQNLHL